MGWLFGKPSPRPRPRPKAIEQSTSPPNKIYKFQVNLSCCETCRKKVKKKLSKIKGVKVVEVDGESVTVTGAVASSVLIDAIKEKGRKAKLESTKEEEKKEEKKEEEAKSKSKKEDADKCSYKNEGEKPSANPNGGNGKEAAGKRCERESSEFKVSSCSGGPVQPPLIAPYQYPYPPMLPPYGPPPGYAGQVPYPYQPGASQPPAFQTKPPPQPYPNDFYGRKPDPQSANSFYDSFNDNNTNACSIM